MNKIIEYNKRITDHILEEKLQTFGGVLINGPKSCGKTTSAKQYAKSTIEFQDESKRKGYILVAESDPHKLLDHPKPLLIDEWQDIPEIWGAVRKSIDDEQALGYYILTGSTSNVPNTPHTGTGRISTMKMYPMSLFESNESNGQVSLSELFNTKKIGSCKSDLSLDDLIFAICRGGWPSTLKIQKKEFKLMVAKDIVNQIINKDMIAIDNRKRNPKVTKAILQSYSRNICTLAKYKTIQDDISPNNKISNKSFSDYIEKLEELYIIDDIDAWSPNIRSQTRIRTGMKRNFIDPSIAVASLNIGPEYFNSDFRTLGFLFECLCIRDLKVYSSKLGGTISHYKERGGLEVDAVLHLDDGRYALIEFKLGSAQIEQAAKNLLQVEHLIIEKNKEAKKLQERLPDLKIIITSDEYGYVRNDGVFVIPIGCLKD